MNSLLIAQNIIKRTLRNKREFIALILLPIIAIGLITTLVGEALQGATKIGVHNGDQGLYGEELSNYLQRQEGIEVVPVLGEEEKVSKQKKLQVILTIPEDFSEKVKLQEKTDLTLWSRGDRGMEEDIRGRINEYVFGLYATEAMVSKLGQETSLPKEVIEARLSAKGEEKSIGTKMDVTANENTTTNLYEVLRPSLGFVLVFIMVFIFNIMGTMMEDKKKLILARIFVFPVKEWEIILGNLLGGLGLGTLQLIPIVLVLKVVYEIPWGTGLLSLFLVLFSFLITTIGLGIGLSGVLNAFNPTTIIATVIVPTSLLGGAFVPESMMPAIIGKLGHAVPQKWVISAIEKSLSGGSITEISSSLLIILLFGLTFATFGLKTIRPLSE